MPLERIRELKDLPYLMRKKPHLQQRGRILSTKPVRIINPKGKKSIRLKIVLDADTETERTSLLIMSYRTICQDDNKN